MPGTSRRLIAINPTGLASGAEISLLRLLSMAQEAGWEIEVLAPDGPLVEQLAIRGLARTRIPDLKLPDGPRSLGISRAAVRALSAGPTIRRRCVQADVVIVNGLLALPALRIAHVRAPVVWLVHDIIARRAWHAVVRFGAPRITIGIAPSEAAAKPVRQHGIDVRVIHHGTPWPVPPAAPDPSGPPIVGQAALLTPWKGQRLLLEAIAGLGHREVIVELLGGTFPKDQPYEDSLRERAQRPDLAGRVRFLGHDPEPVSRMRNWTISALPSVEPDCAPFVVIEAMSIGLPVVTTNHGGSAEWLDGAGLLIPPNDVEALSAAIERLLSDDELRARSRVAGPAQVGEGFTLERQRDSFLNVLDALQR